jgi:hypothetical protein
LLGPIAIGADVTLTFALVCSVDIGDSNADRPASRHHHADEPIAPAIPYADGAATDHAAAGCGRMGEHG